MWIDNVAEYLEDTLSGHSRGTTIFTHHLPDTPDSAMCIYDAGTETAPYGPETPWARYTCEVRVRAASYSAADTLMALVRAALHFKSNDVWDTTLKVKWSRALSEPTFLEYDAHRRAILLCRFGIVAERASGEMY